MESWSLISAILSDSGVTKYGSNVSEMADEVWNITTKPMNFSATYNYNSSITTNHSNSNKWCEQSMSFAINSIGAGLLCILGFIGNAVSYVIISSDKTTSPVAAFLLESLSFADNLFLFVWFLHFTLNNFFTFFGLDRTFSVAYIYTRAYTYPLLFIAQTATIWLTVLIAASRCIAVCRPYRASVYCTIPVTIRGTIGVAAFAVIYNLPRFFETKIATTTRKNITRYSLQRTEMGRNDLYQLIYFDVLYYIFSFVLPLLLLSAFNTKLIVAYRAVQRKRSAMKMRSRAETQEQNITLVMIVVILVFMICNAPARIVQIVWQYNPQVCRTAPYFLMQLSNVLEVFSSSSNFLVYCGFRKQFRRSVRRRFSVCASRSGIVDPSDQTTVHFTESPMRNEDEARRASDAHRQSVV